MMVKDILAPLWSNDCKERDERYYEELIPNFPFKSDIPLEIHQTYYKHELPKVLVEHVEALKALNPECTYTLWNDAELERFIVENYGEKLFQEYYKRIGDDYGAAKADLFRYLLIYKCGGLYLDIKSSLSIPLKDLVSTGYTAYLAHWDNQPGGIHEGTGLGHSVLNHIPGGEYVQWFLCFSPGHPLLRRVIIEILKSIDRYNIYVQGVGQMGVLYTTGPIPYSLAIHKGLQADRDIAIRCLDAGSVINLKLDYTVLNHVDQHLKLIKSYRFSVNPVLAPRGERCPWLHHLYRMIRYYSLRFRGLPAYK